ncbi:TIGR02221 family CRISPR-associated protein [Caldicellulosiruptoraceae bacterium PP1]
MAKKFLSFLGANNYNECIYNCPNEKQSSKFIQEALIKDLCKDWTQKDKAIIFLTKKARNYNWENHAERGEGLAKKLNKLKDTYKLQIIDKDIPDGQNVDEIWDIFRIMIDSLNDDDEVIFDITHSFRSIPMLALVVLNYAKVIKNIKIIGIYYGAFDAKDENNIAPVFNLNEFDRLLEWAYSINSFIKFGNSKQILELVKEAQKTDERYRGDIYRFVTRLNDFTSNILTCRGMQNEEIKKSVSAAYKKVKESIEIVKTKNIVPPIIPLVELVENRTMSFDCNDNLETGIAFIEWCIDNNLVQQGYTALDETIKTYICNKFNLDQKNKTHRENIAAMAINVYQKSEDKWYVNDEYKDIVKKIIKETPKELFEIADSVRNARNDINHFGFKSDINSIKSYETLERDLKSLYDRFKKILKNKF